jgi:hypothetical protein
VANKLSNAVANIITKLKELATAKLVKAVDEGMLNPTTADFPRISVALSRYFREGSVWTAELLLLVGQAPTPEITEAGVELGARVDAKIAELVAAGTSGAVIDQPKLDVWRQPGTDKTLVCTGLWGTLRLRLEGPLLIPDPPEE